ncbi:glycosyltransferase [Murimonas intestini]|nr:glycosyltransferase [Murimonas intestini]MCR1840690.1 glycosyltransferase [Murimonas intestini]
MKKKIAFFTPTVYAIGGESRVVTIIANELHKYYDITIFTREKKILNSIYGLNDDIKVVSYYPYSKLPIASSIRYIYRKTKLTFLEDNIWLLNYAYYSKTAVRKMKKLVIGSFNAIIAVSGDMSILLGKCKLKELITIGWEHSSYEAYFQTPHRYLWKREAIFRKAMEGLSHCIVLNEDIAEKYKKNIGVTSDYIYNPRSFVSYEKSKLINKQFVAFGNFVEAKGFDLLIESFNIFSKINQEWRLVIAGDGPDFLKIKEKVTGYNLQDRIVFPGYLQDVQSLLIESSVYLLSSRWEGFPMCVTEAYEVGLPIICYDIPAIIPLTRNHEGIIIEKFNTEHFAFAMLMLAEDFKMRAEMAENAKKMAESISIENIISRWLELIEK